MNHVAKEQDIQQDECSCAHDTTIEDNGKTICIDCGTLLSDRYIIKTYSNTTGIRRKKKVDAIYNDLPAYISQTVKELAINIYQSVTCQRVFRASFKRAILAACLHRAALLQNCAISYDDLLEIFSLNQNDANKGFNRVHSYLPKDSEFTVPFNAETEESLIIGTLIRNAGMLSISNATTSLFQMVKKRSNIINESLCKSVVCGCIYFWVKMKKIPKTLKEMSQIMGMSEMTILNKYVVIYDTVLSAVMKDLFVSLLSKAKPTQNEGRNKYKSVFKDVKHGTLYCPESKVLVFDPFTSDISVVHASSREALPIDDVDDVIEWNMLLNQNYFDADGRVYTLNITMSKNTRDYTFDFKKYNCNNTTDGEEQLREIICSLFP